MSRARRVELGNVGVRADLRRHIADFKTLATSGQLELFDNEESGMLSENQESFYGLLPFDTKPLEE